MYDGTHAIIFRSPSQANLLDNVRWTEGKYLDEDGQAVNANQMHYSDLIPVEFSHDYVLTYIPREEQQRIRVHGYDANGTWIRQLGMNDRDSIVFGKEQSISFSVGTCKYVRISICKYYQMGYLEDLTVNAVKEVNTWDDWCLIPTSRPTMSTPGAQNRFVEVPGMNGSYDLSNYLTPDIVYSDRSGSFEFIVDRDLSDWRTAYRKVISYLHGQRLQMILTDDPAWYYEGRFTLDDFKSEPQYSKITISYRVAPFKISVYADFPEDILWDPFNFDLDIDWGRYYHLTSTSTPKTYQIDTEGFRTKVMVRLVSGGPVTASFGGITQTVSGAGRIVTLGNSERTGKSPLTLSGSGVVDIGWRKLSL